MGSPCRCRQSRCDAAVGRRPTDDRQGAATRGMASSAVPHEVQQGELEVHRVADHPRNRRASACRTRHGARAVRRRARRGPHSRRSTTARTVGSRGSRAAGAGSSVVRTCAVTFCNLRMDDPEATLDARVEVRVFPHHLHVAGDQVERRPHLVRHAGRQSDRPPPTVRRGRAPRAARTCGGSSPTAPRSSRGAAGRVAHALLQRNVEPLHSPACGSGPSRPPELVGAAHARPRAEVAARPASSSRGCRRSAMDQASHSTSSSSVIRTTAAGTIHRTTVRPWTRSSSMDASE